MRHQGPAAIDLKSSAVPSDVGEALFKDVCRHWLTGVTVVTTECDGELLGATVSAASPLSLSPAQFLVCLGLTSETLGCIKRRGYFCINILGAEQSEIALSFARKGGGKFGNIPHLLTESGIPYLHGSVASIECMLSAVVAAGDHEILIGDAGCAQVKGGAPLAYYGSKLSAFVPPTASA